MLATDAADRSAGRAPRRATLADGREILYFDDPGSAPGPPPPDRRAIQPVSEPSELRQDPLLDEPVIVATHRQGRTHLPRSTDCPLCPSRAGHETEIPASDYDVAVFENRFPSLPAVAPPGTEPAGRCEVICYASEHTASFASLAPDRLATIAAAWVHRTVALESLPGVAYTLAFENRGEEMGVTLHHPHGQVYAYPYLPPRVARMLEVAERASGCIGCAELDRELASERVVAENADAVAYVPESARWPYEVHIVPRRHAPSLAALEVGARTAMTALAAETVGRLDRLFDRDVPYMAGWLTAPVGADPERWHLRLQVVSPQRDAGKLKYLAGSESLAGAFINDVRPEEAARRLRDIGPGDQA